MTRLAVAIAMFWLLTPPPRMANAILIKQMAFKMDCGEDGITDTMDLCTGDYNIGGALSPVEAEFGRLRYWGENHLETPIYTTVCPGEPFPFAD
jgi:hypothetical protein